MRNHPSDLTHSEFIDQCFHKGRTYIGIDNGVTGSIGIVPFTGTNPLFFHTPTISCLNYQKKAKNITRIDVRKLHNLLAKVQNPLAILERPLVNPGMFSATMSAVRALESTLTVIDYLLIPYLFIDSREWQKEMLPSGLKGNQLKVASLYVGKRLFPFFHDKFKKDADGILIAEWARRKML